MANRIGNAEHIEWAKRQMQKATPHKPRMTPGMRKKIDALWRMGFDPGVTPQESRSFKAKAAELEAKYKG